ncbi:MAG: cobaltochelatase subunit CobN [Methanoregulaceae archaeon PtaB.Bin056]|nr:MAG: cobaltochelatase subunit CobN [Methanoregulaceae archaeon PtaB.Bin056]
MRLTAIVWGSEIPMLVTAAAETGVSLRAHPTYRMRDPAYLDSCIRELGDSDIILLHPTNDAYWDTLIPALPPGVPVISFGHDQSFWTLSTVPLPVTATVNAYFIYGGSDNMRNLVRFIQGRVLSLPVTWEEPSLYLWEGVYHPDAPRVFSTADEYWQWRGREKPHTIGILFYRIYWANGDLQAIDALIRECEREYNAIAVFSVGTGDSSAGALDATEVIQRFLPDVDALVCLQSSALSHDPDEPVRVFEALGVPVVHPLMLYYRTEEEWKESLDGMGSIELGWSVVLPEMYGMTGMIPVASAMAEGPLGPGHAWHSPVRERIRALVRRIGSLIRLREKPPAEKRVAFVLNSSACASVEANVGAAAHLDTLQSVADILSRMKEEGFCVEAPESGEALAKAILDRRAINEFRWTTVQDIVKRGGALGMVEKETYDEWFSELPAPLRSRIAETWGDPPGEAKDGVPPAMLYDGKMVIPGLSFGNAVVCTQPKRGCAGSRCDGQVCRILHDPQVPPPHHYLAVYRYLERVFGADLIVHVGTHGSLEFLPGKSVAPSNECLPDAILGDLPLLYIYNSDNPSEGTIAKRRAGATIIDHLQTVMAPTSPYGVLKDLEEKIAEYHKFAGSDGARAHALQHQIIDLVTKEGLDKELGILTSLHDPAAFERLLEGAGRLISGIYGTRIPEGMHVFGRIPAGRTRARFIAPILNHDGHLHRLIAGMMGLDERISPSETALVRVLDGFSEDLVSRILEGEGLPQAPGRVLGDSLVRIDEGGLASLEREVREISRALDRSDEIGSLINGTRGGYIQPGPSGLLSRGKTGILPTGRNFYSLDPSSVPTEAAWEVGTKLAGILVERHRQEHGSYPENVALLWMASDIMWADGEQCAQALALIGAEPVREHGRLKGVRIIPLERLGRPRIDITVRVSGILRDCFFGCVEFLDDAIRAVAALDEPPEWNYLRKHSAEGGIGPRIFGAPRGTYGMGVNLAVYASAWDDVSDLADVFIYWNGYSYGRGVFGEKSTEHLVSQLRTVDVTFNKTATDEYDLLGCCCYFGSHGGMTAAAREVSGKEVSAYYGDTRNTSQVDVRTLADELRRVVRTKLLNPQYIDALKEHGYAGAAELSKRAGRVFGWDATTGEVDDRIFDDIARTFLLDEKNREFFREHNIWAMEEMGRRLLEAQARGMWQADDEVLEELRAVYLQIEGDLEDEMGVSSGDRQGGAIEVFSPEEMKAWKEQVSHLKRHAAKQ